MKIDGRAFWLRVDSELIASEFTLRDMCKDIGVSYFTVNTHRNWGTKAVGEVLMIACGAYPEERDIFSEMKSHTLRHSMNTNLLASGLPPLLVAEYLSWNHQCILDMQQRYTHVYAESMRPVADKIDELYCLPAKMSELKRQA